MINQSKHPQDTMRQLTEIPKLRESDTPELFNNITGGEKVYRGALFIPELHLGRLSSEIKKARLYGTLPVFMETPDYIGRGLALIKFSTDGTSPRYTSKKPLLAVLNGQERKTGKDIKLAFNALGLKISNATTLEAEISEITFTPEQPEGQLLKRSAPIEGPEARKELGGHSIAYRPPYRVATNLKNTATMRTNEEPTKAIQLLSIDDPLSLDTAVEDAFKLIAPTNSWWPDISQFRNHADLGNVYMIHKSAQQDNFGQQLEHHSSRITLFDADYDGITEELRHGIMSQYEPCEP